MICAIVFGTLGSMILIILIYKLIRYLSNKKINQFDPIPRTPSEDQESNPAKLKLPNEEVIKDKMFM